MFNNIYFIGGIHCSGKGTIVQKMISNSELIHLEASKVLKWENISEKENKKVDDINVTQKRLITNLEMIVNNEKKYLLDGHYCLINKQNEVEKVSLETFKKINPLLFIIKIDDPIEIKKRLEKRDSKVYDLDFLIQFQNDELNYARFLSDSLQKPLFILDKDLGNLLKHIKNENPS